MTRRDREDPLSFRRILVALDADALASHALPAACRLAARSGAKLDVVHVVEQPGATMQVIEAVRALSKGRDPLDSVRATMVERVREVIDRDAIGGIDAQRVVDVVYGQPAQALLARARESHADLIVLGALHRRRLLDFGSTARAVLAHAPCAVWVQPVPDTALRTILVPYDMSSESRRALGIACRLARHDHAAVRVLHAFDSAVLMGGLALDGIDLSHVVEERMIETRRRFTEEMDAADWSGLAHEVEFVEASPVDAIRRASRSSDLIVMGTHGLTGLSAVLLGSTTYAVLKHADKPVLVVRDPARRFQHE